jgi:putative autotransporter adhesin-like protein
MSTEDTLREAIASMSGGEVTTPDLATVIDRATPPRRSQFRVVLVVASAALLLGGGWLLVGPASSPAPRSAATVADCPGNQSQRFATMSEAQLQEIGAADALPEYGTTTKPRVAAALAENAQYLSSNFPNARASIGPGLGVTYDPSDPNVYRHAPDYQVYVQFGSRDECETAGVTFLLSGDARIPIRYVYPQPSAAHDHAYDVAGVTSATFGGGLAVSLRAGEPHMTINAVPDVMRDIKVSLRDGKVTVARHSPQSRQKYHVTVTMTGVQLNELSASGGVELSTGVGVFAVDFSATLSGGVDWTGQIQGSSAVISASGGVEAHLSGQLSELELIGRGGVDIDAGSVLAQTLSVTAEGGTIAAVHATGRFSKAVAHGGSSITYSGVKPESVDRDISSSVNRR